MTKFPVVQPTAKSVCVCGHEGDGAGSAHAPASGPTAGHGQCMAGGCKCGKFRWASFVPGVEPVKFRDIMAAVREVNGA